MDKVENRLALVRRGGCPRNFTVMLVLKNALCKHVYTFTFKDSYALQGLDKSLSFSNLFFRFFEIITFKFITLTLAIQIV